MWIGFILDSWAHVLCIACFNAYINAIQFSKGNIKFMIQLLNQANKYYEKKGKVLYWYSSRHLATKMHLQILNRKCMHEIERAVIVVVEFKRHEHVYTVALENGQKTKCTFEQCRLHCKGHTWNSWSLKYLFIKHCIPTAWSNTNKIMLNVCSTKFHHFFWMSIVLLPFTFAESEK